LEKIMETLEPCNAPAETGDNATFDLALWLGRHQAFGLIASQCSAADAHSLREIRDRKLYRSLDLDWKEFCGRYAGVCHKTADQIISRLEEFGESYFNLSQIVPIRTPDYRAIAPVIEDNSLEFEGRRIPITRAHTQELMQAVRSLRAELDQAKKRPSPLDAIDDRLDRSFGEIGGMMLRGVSAENREAIVFLLERFIARAEAYRVDFAELSRIPEATPQTDD
jgi:hypothetical protein